MLCVCTSRSRTVFMASTGFISAMNLRMFSDSGEVTAVLDIDSKELATFDDTDRTYLEAICGLIASIVQ